MNTTRFYRCLLPAIIDDRRTITNNTNELSMTELWLKNSAQNVDGRKQGDLLRVMEVIILRTGRRFFHEEANETVKTMRVAKIHSIRTDVL